MMMLTRNDGITSPDRQFCTGPLASHVEGFAAQLSCMGYAPNTVRTKCDVIADLNRWLERRLIPLAELNEGLLRQFQRARPRTGRDEAKRLLVSSFLRICAIVTTLPRLHCRSIEPRRPALFEPLKNFSVPNVVCHGQQPATI